MQAKDGSGGTTAKCIKCGKAIVIPVPETPPVLPQLHVEAPQKQLSVDLRALNKICFTICIVCIVLGTALSLVMIWGEIKDNSFVWKSWLTIGVFFLASALTLSVSRTFEGRRGRT